MTADLKDKIIVRLKQLGMSQRELAKEIGVTEATISRYVNGERIPSHDLLLKLANALEVSADYFTDCGDRKVEDIEQITALIARNGKQMTPEEKLAIIKLLSL